MLFKLFSSDFSLPPEGYLRDALQGRLRIFPFQPAEQEQQQEEGDQGQGEENRAAATVEDGVDDGGIYFHGEPGEGKNAKAVAEDGQGDNRQGQNRAVSGAAQQEVAGHQAGDKEHEGRPDAAAFLGDLDRQARQIKIEAFPQSGETRQFDHGRGGGRGGVLEENL